MYRILTLVSLNFLFAQSLVYRTAIKASLNDLPREIVKKTLNKGPLGTTWSVIDVIDNIKNHNVDGVSFATKNDAIQGIVAIDSDHLDFIDSMNLHPIAAGGSTSISNILLKELVNNHVDFDTFNVPPGAFEDIPFPLQFIGGYLFFLFVLNAIRLIFMPNQNFNGNKFSNPLMDVFQKPDLIDFNKINITFTDVAGCDEAKFELQEVVDFLKQPDKYKQAGAKMPKGVLLEGPPGTGKTLLAQAVAGEAQVAFLTASASEFIEMFVGVGASRVRKLFEQAASNKPCVIFIDEIDAIGRQRGTGIAGGNDEREQTLNELLTRMDGFTKEEGIVVIAATNRADILDSALLRPGRFDRKVQVTLPDKQGRKDIFKVHLKDKMIKDVDYEKLSSLTSGFSGADIANLANEAAILSVRYNETDITNRCIEDAYEKVTIGLPFNKDFREKDILELVAWHEAGHALTAHLFQDFFNVRKVTINANKGGAGGYTLFTPNERYNTYPTKMFMLANLIVALGGRAAEKVLYSTQKVTILSNCNKAKIFDGFDDLDITTGAANDLKQANSIARRYVSLFGLSDNIALYDSSSGGESPFLGRDLAMGGDKLSEYTKEYIDKEVESLINFAYNTAISILLDNKATLIDFADTLIENKTINNMNYINVNYY